MTAIERPLPRPELETEELLVNMGPQHPSTHGVLRLVIRTDGEMVRETWPHIGYLHRCFEKIGQEVTFLDPEYSTTRWVGFKGVVKANPFYQICRSQQDVQIQGDWQKLKNEVRDSHWMMVYGDYVREAGFAARKLGLEWVSVST